MSGLRKDLFLEGRVGSLESCRDEPFALGDVLKILNRFQLTLENSSRSQKPCNSPLARAKQEYKRRKDRFRILPEEVLGEPAWDLLVDLYIMTLEGRRVSVSSACIALHAPPSTGLRWIALLVDFNLIKRVSSPIDRRVTYLELTTDGFKRIDEYFRNLHIDVDEFPNND